MIKIFAITVCLILSHLNFAQDSIGRQNSFEYNIGSGYGLRIGTTNFINDSLGLPLKSSLSANLAYKYSFNHFEFVTGFGVTNYYFKGGNDAYQARLCNLNIGLGYVLNCSKKIAFSTAIDLSINGIHEHYSNFNSIDNFYESQQQKIGNTYNHWNGSCFSLGQNFQLRYKHNDRIAICAILHQNYLNSNLMVRINNMNLFRTFGYFGVGIQVYW